MTEFPMAYPSKPPEQAPPFVLRLLPWTTSEGKPAYLSGNGGLLSDLADEIEEYQLVSARQVLDLAHVVLDNPDAGPVELRFAARRLYESLADALRVVTRTGVRGASLVGALTPSLVRWWPHDPQCVGRARHELRATLKAWELDELTDTAELVLSELLTNAVRHASLPEDRHIETRYELMEAGVRIEVHDANDTRPVLQKPSTEAESGRGLGLVDALTGARWGVSERQGVGKLLWAVVGNASAGEQHGVAV